MPGSRQLIEAFGEWQSCEDATTEARPRSSPASSGVQELNRAMLGRTIEAEVIPRLMMAHRGRIGKEALTLQHVTPDDIGELGRIVIDHETAVASSYVDALRNQGVPIEAIFVELLAPTARLLGEMWKADLCCFTDVTVGMSRLQQIVHELSPEFERETAQAFDGRRILLMTMPGEQHTLGLMIVEEYFRRYGWDCCSSAPKDIRDMTRLARSQHFDVIGISVAWGALLEGITSAIQAIRKNSVNKAVVVMVGGAIFLENPHLVSRVGADCMAEDGRHAILQLKTLLNAKITNV
ncbi:MAG: B12-binding domain-containing protein [Deltaproteobacteria bacterium]